jgi:hypothetical protein
MTDHLSIDGKMPAHFQSCSVANATIQALARFDSTVLK